MYKKLFWVLILGLVCSVIGFAGVSFDDPVTQQELFQRSGGPPTATSVAFATSGPSVYVFWYIPTDPTRGRIFVARSTNGGQSFEKPRLLFEGSGGTIRVAAARGCTVVVLYPFFDSFLGVGALVSFDGGETFFMDRLRGPRGVNQVPHFQVEISERGRIYVGWDGGDGGGGPQVVFFTSFNDGVTVQLTDSFSTFEQFQVDDDREVWVRYREGVTTFLQHGTLKSD